MYRALFLLLALILACNEENVDSGTKTDVDAYACESAVTCEGSYYLSSGEDLEDIALCECITGHLEMKNETWLTSVVLPSLTTVDGDLSFQGNDYLTTIEMPGLTTVGRDFLLGTTSGNALLTGLEMTSFTSVGRHLTVIGNDALTNLEGLSSLESVGFRHEEVGMTGDLDIYLNASLCQSDAEAFAASIEVGGEVYVENNGNARTDCN